MKNVFVHVGMHKTATTTMQKVYFPIIQKHSQNIRVNDLTLYRYLEKCWKFDVYERGTEFHKIKNHIKSINEANIIISMEAFCGDLFNGYKYENYEEKLLHLKELFSEEKLEILFARRELHGWMISCYKESIKEHHFKTFNTFVDSFESHINGTPIVRAFDIPWLCKKLKIKLMAFEFEDIRRCDKVIANYILKETDNDTALLAKTKSKIKNVGYSFQTIAFIMSLNAICSWLLPRSIFFKGPRSIYKIEMYWNNNFVLRYVKKLGFPLWRGRWFRFAMIRLDRSEIFRARFIKQANDLKLKIEQRTASW